MKTAKTHPLKNNKYATLQLSPYEGVLLPLPVIDPSPVNLFHRMTRSKYFGKYNLARDFKPPAHDASFNLT